MIDSEIIQLLQKEISNTKNSIKQYQEQLKPIAPDCAVDSHSRMDTLIDNQIVKQALKHQQLKLEQLKLVLNSVGDKDFGQCRKCKQPIPLGRILIRPESLYCVHCTE